MLGYLTRKYSSLFYKNAKVTKTQLGKLYVGLSFLLLYICFYITLPLGGGTLGSKTLVCDTSTKMGHFRAKWTQNYSI